ncbi:MAG: radical SAM protein, partial [Nitrospina sp.]|nr:radical SAM protein [Nitrospina sp.]
MSFTQTTSQLETDEAIESPSQNLTPVKKHKIVLFSPKSGEGHRPTIPLALLAISRFLDKDERFEIKIICSEDNQFIENVLDELEGALCLGITCFTGYPVKEAVELASAAKKKFPDIPTIFGGWHPSVLPIETISHPSVDIVVAGQGEKPFTNLINALVSKSNLKDIHGLYFKDSSGEVVHTGFSELEPIKNFPTLPYHLIKLEDFTFETFFAKKVIDFYTSSGCPFECTFCVEPGTYKRKWNGLPPERVADEWEMLNKKYGIDGINLVDNNFCVNEKRVRGICEELIDRSLSISWGPADGVIEQLLKYSGDTWELMSKGGCTSILVGADSAMNEGLKIVKKHNAVDDIYKFVEICNKHNIKPALSFMIGLPSEDKDFVEKEYQATLDLFDKIYKKVTCLHLFLFTPYPGSELYGVAINKGWKPPTSLEGWSKLELQTTCTPWVPKKYSLNVEFLQEYVLRFLDGSFKEIFKNRRNPIVRATLLLVFPILQGLALARWKLRYFGSCIELSF